MLILKLSKKQDYEFKKRYAYIRAWEFYNEAAKRDLNVHVSVGGLDSITLFMFLRSIGINAPGISVSTLEDVSIQRVHKQLKIERLKSAVRYVDENGTEHRWKKPEILQEYWMYNCCTDDKTGERYGWARVLDYINVDYKEENR